MAKLPVVSGAQLVQALKRKGFVVLRQRGSHIVLQKRAADHVLITVVPNHSELARGTLSAILRQTRLSSEDLIKLLTLVLGSFPLMR